MGNNKIRQNTKEQDQTRRKTAQEKAQKQIWTQKHRQTHRYGLGNIGRDTDMGLETYADTLRCTSRSLRNTQNWKPYVYVKPEG